MWVWRRLGAAFPVLYRTTTRLGGMPSTGRFVLARTWPAIASLISRRPPEVPPPSCPDVVRGVHRGHVLRPQEVGDRAVHDPSLVPVDVFRGAVERARIVVEDEIAGGVVVAIGVTVPGREGDELGDEIVALPLAHPLDADQLLRRGEDREPPGHGMRPQQGMADIAEAGAILWWNRLCQRA